MTPEHQEQQITIRIADNLLAPGGKCLRISFQAVDKKVGHIEIDSTVARKIAAKMKTFATELDRS